MGYFDESKFLDEYIIKDRTVLKPEYQPEKLEERDEELDEYIKLLRPLLKGWDLDNLFVYGASGVGKTVATRTLLPDLRENAAKQGIDVDIIETNCSSANTSYQSAIEVINEARNPQYPLTTLSVGGEEMSKTGHPAEKVYDTLFKELEKGSEHIILVLDEINTLGSDSELLYQLTRAQTMQKLDAEVCIIGISNDFDFKDNLPARVKDTLCESELHFPPYERKDLLSIINRRVDRAFYDGACPNAAIELCVGLSVRDRGSARQAIRLLRKAAEIAENEAMDGKDVEEITEEHVREAERIIEKKHVSTGIQKLTHHRKYTLLAIANLAAEGNTPCQTAKIYEYYKLVAEEHGRDPLTRRGAHEHLLEMVDNGILKNVNRSSKGRGRPNKYKLDTPFETVVNALENSDDGEIKNLDELRNKAKKNNLNSL